MKYIIKQIHDDFIFDELETVRKQFIEALNYTMESATVYFDKNANNPLDFYIAYDFQQKNGDYVVYGFNLRDEIIRHFKLDSNKYHSSKLLLEISQQLGQLSDELKDRYDPEPTKTLAEARDKKDAEYAKNVNRSYRDILKEAMAKDEEERMKKSKDNSGLSDEERKDDGYQNQTILLKGKLRK